MPAPPSLTLTAARLAEVEDAQVLAVPVESVDGTARPGAQAGEVAAAFGLDLDRLLAREKAKGEPGEVLAVPVVAGTGPATVEQVLFAGVGDGGATALRRAGAAVARRAKGHALLATSIVTAAGHEELRAFAEGVVLSSYALDRRSRPRKPAPVERVVLALDRPDTRQEALDRAVSVAAAVWLGRDLTNTPSNEKTPAWLAARAEELTASAGLDVEVWEGERLAAEGFGGIIGVGMGSAQPPRFVQLRYTPEPVDGDGGQVPHVVLVGKGITFDSGGLSLKPLESMVNMKTDMSGAAAVIATMSALRDLRVGVRVTGLVAAAENLPSGSALRPSDVITHYGGRTVEVLNTDAEGRLVLADALAYADAHLDPDAVVDLATLTGAATLGLGRRHAALYSTDDRLADALVAAGELGGERLWRMPFVEDYRFCLDSDVADLANISRDPYVSGGSIIAALFLREFSGGRPWAHLDIAGPARAEGDEHELTKGGTGFGTRTLLRWLESRRPVRRRKNGR